MTAMYCVSLDIIFVSLQETWEAHLHFIVGTLITKTFKNQKYPYISNTFKNK